jgi:hypothetical protein
MRFRHVLAALSAFAIAACSDGSDGSNGNTTRLSIQLTDAPGDISEAVVTVSEIYLQGSNGRTVLRDADTTLNLVDLANATADMVNGAEVPQGTYEQLRFVITGAYIKVEEDGGSKIYATSTDYAGLPAGATVDGNLQTPSFSTSGVKVTLPGDQLVLDTDQKILLVDFDVSQSFGKQAGNSGQWVMTPVIKGADITVSGGLVVNATLAAGVTADLSQWKAQATIQGGSTEELPLTDPDADGTFSATFDFLFPGSNSVTLVPPTGTFASTPVLPVNQTVDSGANATVNVTVDAYTP